MRKELKTYRDVLSASGLHVEHAKAGHYKVRTSSGKYVASVSHSGERNALRQSIRDLVRAGLLPASARRVKF